MKSQVPPKLQPGDVVRVIAPSMSLSYWRIKRVQDKAIKQLQNLGLIVSYGHYAKIKDHFQSSSIDERVADFHDALMDPSVKLILAAIGGFNSNQLLGAIDYELIAKNPKHIMSHSDGISFLTSIYVKTGLITYSGPTFFAFGEISGFSYTLDYVRKALFNKNSYKILPSRVWSSDRVDKDKRMFIPNDGYWVIQEGIAKGTIIGDNLCTLQLLQGTEYWPSLKESVLFLEEDDASGSHTLEEFDRNLESLTQQKDFQFVRGIVIGRFKKNSRVEKKFLSDVIKNKNKLRHLPVVANVDFGHTLPRITLPIGGTASLSVDKEVKIEIIQH